MKRGKKGNRKPFRKFMGCSGHLMRGGRRRTGKSRRARRGEGGGGDCHERFSRFPCCREGLVLHSRKKKNKPF